MFIYGIEPLSFGSRLWELNVVASIRVAKDSVKMHCSSQTRFRDLTEVLTAECTEFHTFRLDDAKERKFVIRGLSSKTPINLVEEELKRAKVKFKHVL